MWKESQIKIMDPLTIILHILSNESKDNSYYGIAHYVLKNPTLIQNMTINHLADVTFVSPSTITRFVQYIGFTSYIEFRKYFESSFSLSNQIIFRLNQSDDENLRNQPQRYLRSHLDDIHKSLEDTFNNFDFKAIDALIERVSNTNSVALFGYSDAHSIAKEMQVGLMAKRKYVDVPHSLDAFEAILKTYDEHSLIIILSNYGNFFNHVRIHFDTLVAKRIPTILVTQNYQAQSNLFESTILLNSHPASNVGNYALRLFTDYFVRRFAYKD